MEGVQIVHIWHNACLWCVSIIQYGHWSKNRLREGDVAFKSSYLYEFFTV